MNHAISGEILVQEVRFPRSEIFLATLFQTSYRPKPRLGQLQLILRLAQLSPSLFCLFFHFNLIFALTPDYSTCPLTYVSSVSILTETPAPEL